VEATIAPNSATAATATAGTAQEEMNQTHCIPVVKHTEDVAVVEQNPSLHLSDVLHMLVSFC